MVIGPSTFLNEVSDTFQSNKYGNVKAIKTQGVRLLSLICHFGLQSSFLTTAKEVKKIIGHHSKGRAKKQRGILPLIFNAAAGGQITRMDHFNKEM
jgi:hypothetical protein